MNFNSNEDNDLDEEEQRRMAEELGINLDELNLMPEQNDKSLLTPQVAFQPKITVDAVTPNSQVA